MKKPFLSNEDRPLIDIVCQECGKVVKKKFPSNAKTCSDECRLARMRRLNRGRRQRSPIVTRVCPCGTEFQINKLSRKIYHSSECARRFGRANLILTLHRKKHRKEQSKRRWQNKTCTAIDRAKTRERKLMIDKYGTSIISKEVKTFHALRRIEIALEKNFIDKDKANELIQAVERGDTYETYVIRITGCPGA